MYTLSSPPPRFWPRSKCVRRSRKAFPGLGIFGGGCVKERIWTFRLFLPSRLHIHPFKNVCTLICRKRSSAFIRRSCSKQLFVFWCLNCLLILNSCNLIVQKVYPGKMSHIRRFRIICSFHTFKNREPTVFGACLYKCLIGWQCISLWRYSWIIDW